MTKNFKTYSLIWIILLLVFNAVVFLVRPIIPGYEISYDLRFWIAWAFIIAAFVGNLICTNTSFKAENLKKLFYNISLITVSWSAMIAILTAGCVLMLIPDCPAWITAIVCIIIFAFNAIAVIKVSWAAEIVENVDEKVHSRISFIKNLTVEAESILSRVKSDAVKAECKKVYEAIRYSDPMSSEALSGIEAEITVKMDDFKIAVGSDNMEKVKQIADELVALVGDRNKRCKALK